MPIKRLEQRLEEGAILDREGQGAINAEIMAQVEEAVTFAVNSPYPDPEDALKGVFSD